MRSGATAISQFLSQKPFNLDADAIAWVERTRDALDFDARIGQLFNYLSIGNDPLERERYKRLKPGGVTRAFTPAMDHEIDFLDALQSDAAVPLLVSADLEGSRMSLPFATQLPNPIALAAVDDEEATRAISAIMAREAVALGVNWSFTPVLDINATFRSAIVATRGFGSDPAIIRRHALAQIDVFQRHGVAATVKHWPGEGHDDRDQHLVTTINPLSRRDWDASYGALYQAAIDAGVLSVMSAHIAFPAYVRGKMPDAGLEAFRPASVNALLNNDLLRGELGFNGLIVSDATPMAGLGAWMPAPRDKVAVIANGCDMILFSRNPEEDVAAVAEAVRSGTISEERLHDALTRILGLKAALGLHTRKRAPRAARVAQIQSAENQEFAEAIIQRAPVLVKDVNSLFPLDPERHRRVLIYSGGIVSPLHTEPFDFVLPDLLLREGFEVTMYKPGIESRTNAFDLVLYLFGEETLLTRGRIFLDWAKLAGNFMAAMDRPWHAIATAMISFGYPYYLYDAPRVPAYVNAWSTTDAMQRAVLNCMLGRAPWNRHSPVDAFCGLEDARY